MRVKFASVLLLVGILIAACAYNIGYVNTMYDALAVSKLSYETTMESTHDLFRRGVITQEEKDKVFEIGRKYMKAHNAAVDALASYEESGMTVGQKQIEIQAKAASKALSEVLDMVKPYLLRSK